MDARRIFIPHAPRRWPPTGSPAPWSGRDSPLLDILRSAVRKAGAGKPVAAACMRQQNMSLVSAAEVCNIHRALRELCRVASYSEFHARAPEILSALVPAEAVALDLLAGHAPKC